MRLTSWNEAPPAYASGVSLFPWHFLLLQSNEYLDCWQYQVQYDVCRTILQNFREIAIFRVTVLGIQCEENWCLYEILKFALLVCLQKCSALSLNLKICSIFSAFNSSHNTSAEQMRQCYTALGIAHQSSRICGFLGFIFVHLLLTILSHKNIIRRNLLILVWRKMY